MNGNAVKARADAREVVAFLKSIGEHKRANDVQRIIRSSEASATANSLLHRDNMALRNR